ncbi:MAG: rhomboid family intramembrane serine protease [Bdellovibrionia bacterium]
MNRVQMNMAVPLTPVVKILLFATVGIWFFLQVLLEGFAKIPFTSIFGLYPHQVLFDWHIWQVFTYQFLHSNSVTHILFNMLMLWFFGAELEQRWGSRFFAIYYLMSGVGAALIYILGMAIYAAVTGAQAGLYIPVIGASGSVFGLMLAHGLLFGERIIYFFMLFPMKTKFFVLIMGLVQIASMMTSSVAGGEVAYLAHLGGLVAGFILLKGRGYYMERESKKRVAKKGRNLRLVVDNEKKDADKGPRYWN